MKKIMLLTLMLFMLINVSIYGMEEDANQTSNQLYSETVVEIKRKTQTGQEDPRLINTFKLDPHLPIKTSQDILEIDSISSMGYFKLLPLELTVSIFKYCNVFSSIRVSEGVFLQDAHLIYKLLVTLIQTTLQLSSSFSHIKIADIINLQQFYVQFTSLSLQKTCKSLRLFLRIMLKAIFYKFDVINKPYRDILCFLLLKKANLLPTFNHGMKLLAFSGRNKHFELTDALLFQNVFRVKKASLLKGILYHDIPSVKKYFDRCCCKTRKNMIFSSNKIIGDYSALMIAITTVNLEMVDLIMGHDNFHGKTVPKHEKQYDLNNFNHIKLRSIMTVALNCYNREKKYAHQNNFLSSEIVRLLVDKDTSYFNCMSSVFQLIVWAVETNSIKVFDRVVDNEQLLKNASFHGSFLNMACDYSKIMLSPKTRYEIISLLLQRGISVNTLNSSDHTCLPILIRRSLLILAEKNTLADIEVLLKSIQELLNHDVDIKIISHNNGDLLKDIDVFLIPNNEDYATYIEWKVLFFLLCYAAKVGDYKLFKKLFKDKAGIKLINEFCISDRATPLMYAVKGGHIAIVKKLLTYNCNVYLRNVDEKNAIMLAIERKNNEITRLLERHIWKIAAYNGDFNTLALLFSSPAKNVHIDAQHDAGYTALMFAVSANKKEATVALLQAGCDVNVLNVWGETALNIANNRNYTEITSLLNIYTF